MLARMLALPAPLLPHEHGRHRKVTVTRFARGCRLPGRSPTGHGREEGVAAARGRWLSGPDSMKIRSRGSSWTFWDN